MFRKVLFIFFTNVKVLFSSLCTGLRLTWQSFLEVGISPSITINPIEKSAYFWDTKYSSAKKSLVRYIVLRMDSSVNLFWVSKVRSTRRKIFQSIRELIVVIDNLILLLWRMECPNKILIYTGTYVSWIIPQIIIRESRTEINPWRVHLSTLINKCPNRNS